MLKLVLWLYLLTDFFLVKTEFFLDPFLIVLWLRLLTLKACLVFSWKKKRQETGIILVNVCFGEELRIHFPAGNHMSNTYILPWHKDKIEVIVHDEIAAYSNGRFLSFRLKSWGCLYSNATCTREDFFCGFWAIGLSAV